MCYIMIICEQTVSVCSENSCDDTVEIFVDGKE